jgi:PII-like signaling protein
MNVKVVRIYLTEREHLHNRIFETLHDEHQVMGVTVYRAISGFGRKGKMHSSTLLELSFDQPVVVEFFDRPERVAEALAAIADLVPAGNVLTFDAVNT